MTLENRKRRATLTFLGMIVLYVVSLMLAVWLQRVVFTEGLANALVAGLPVIAVLLLVWATLRLFLAGDELERRAAGVAAVVTLTLFATATLCWGILEAMAGLPTVSPVWWGALALGTWSLTFSLVFKVRYQ